MSDQTLTAQIETQVRSLLRNLETAPIIGNTKELLYQRLHLLPELTNLEIETKGVISLYPSQKAYATKMKSEADHYEMLKAGLIQKINATLYFHKQGPESRKIVFLNPISEDCISMVQWRTASFKSHGNLKEHYMYVFIRSSDVKELLPVDMLGILEIYYAVRDRFFQNIPKDEMTGTIMFMIGSAHIYLPGQNQQRKEYENTVVSV